jgi:ubiquinone/menaquinone biosynthesis C-methylase UbiE
MNTLQREKNLQQHYEKIGALKDDRLTAFDYNLRNLEIECAKNYIFPQAKLLDVGSGPGLACFEYANRGAQVVGIDYAQSMVDFAQETLNAEYPLLRNNISFNKGSALALPFDEGSFDLVTTHRVLIALLSWDNQKAALKEISRCLKPGGLFMMFEATEEGLKLLNHYRQLFGLEIIDYGGSGDYDRLLFSEKLIYEHMKSDFDLVKVHSFGMYYFLTRILQPLYVSPEKPRYDHKINDVAFQIAQKLPDFENIGHLKGFVWKRRV